MTDTDRTIAELTAQRDALLAVVKHVEWAGDLAAFWTCAMASEGSTR